MKRETSIKAIKSALKGLIEFSMARGTLIKTLKSTLKGLVETYTQEINILETLKPNTVYLTHVYGESLVRITNWQPGRLRVNILASKLGRTGSTHLAPSAFRGAVEVPPSDFPLYVGWPSISSEFESKLKKGAY